MADKDGLQYLQNLAAEMADLYDVVKKDMPDATEEKIRERMQYLYIRRYCPALFRVGVKFTPEQEAAIRACEVRGDKQQAQSIILEGLKKEFPDGKG